MTLGKSHLYRVPEEMLSAKCPNLDHTSHGIPFLFLSHFFSDPSPTAATTPSCPQPPTADYRPPLLPLPNPHGRMSLLLLRSCLSRKARRRRGGAAPGGASSPATTSHQVIPLPPVTTSHHLLTHNSPLSLSLSGGLVAACMFDSCIRY